MVRALNALSARERGGLASPKILAGDFWTFSKTIFRALLKKISLVMKQNMG